MRPGQSPASQPHPILSRRANYSPLDLERAVANIEAAGYRVSADPFLLARRVVLAAWNGTEGYLVAAEEVGLVARQGVGILDPHATPGGAARWQRAGEPERLRKYAEATLARVCDEVQSAPEGARNQTLNRCAYSLGGLLGWDVLNPHEVLEQLLQAAAYAGLPDDEARMTATRALERGAQNPRPKPEPSAPPQSLAARRAARWRTTSKTGGP